ncbi:brain-specific angiogenesis inhibitor 1-associated protein 2-like protein 2 [Cynoglossus semilaevis]|uniref:BAR/IMD domain containing adaptor protein 2 like 2a n=1 Tax=Cynoglossus semilaevis TaxID=244447 RepID=A0A3P8WNH8_CYNSE|nr:brain-specific angiogenesis inhibitor 1-associated protein 2-like protein 2 [Cynoglossus semilaevis]XP_024920520.1 brain-specific angiogenesis inhibitor 1-associated protein 2-like protein 2 [Cynoglossus semilaevis]
MSSSQLHHSTLDIYSHLIDDFNQSVLKLVSLGDQHLQAFKALSVTGDAYFSLLSAIGQKAYHTTSSRSLGDVLLQLSENHKRLMLELDGVFRRFNMEVVRMMEKNSQLDRNYLIDSRNYYETEVHNRAAAAAQERHMRRGYNQDGDYLQFLKESNAEAVEEEERRYRFLAEKHCGLMQSVAILMTKMGPNLQQRAGMWSEEVNVTRQPSVGQLSPVGNSMGIKVEEIRPRREEIPLGKIPSRAPSPVGSISHSAEESLRGRSAKALVAHQPSASHPTLLPFSKGEVITVLVHQPRNGWLFGRAGSSSRQGWFPASYVELLDDLPKSNSYSLSNASLESNYNRSNNDSRSNNYSRSNYESRSNNNSRSISMSSMSSTSSTSGAAPPPPPPPPPPPSSSSSSMSSNRHSTPPTADRRVESNPEPKRPQPRHSHPELFPRGTNPFATVKLKPTHTDDRSAPKVYRN